MPMLGFFKISKRTDSRLPMISPGIRDADILPGSESSMSAGLTLDYSAIQGGGMDSGVPINHTDDVVEVKEEESQRMNKYRKHNSTLSEDELNEIRLTTLGSTKTMIPFHIWIVDGKKIRDDIDIDFTTGGNPGRYKYIPENEIWIDNNVAKDEVQNVLAHELRECMIMETKHKTYDAAHDAANTLEYKLRHEHATDDPYNDDSKGRGSYVGSKEEGFAFRHNLDYGSSLTARAFPDYPQYSDPAMYTQVMERPDANTTPLFNLFNTYFTDDGKISEKTCPDCEVFEFGQWRIGKCDECHGSGCVEDGETCLNCDGTGSPRCCRCEGTGIDMEDVVTTTEDEEDIIETIDESNFAKNAFIKTAITYDSNTVIQKLINIPQIKSLIEQQASGYVDKIMVTTPSTDIQQTQQQMQAKNPQQFFELQPISGNPFGHVWISEDPSSHQKKPLDKIVRIDKVTDLWGTLVTILHEVTHHRHPDWSEAQVESEAKNLADTAQQFIEKAANRKSIVFIKNGLQEFPIIECDIADTYQKQVIGLQNHHTLSYKSGMFFSYNRPQSLSFWMGKVSFPIDIIFADQDNTIVKIFRNCLPNSPAIYSCDNASRVIEVVGSFCAFHDINPGDHIMAVDDKGLDEQEIFIKHILEKIKDAKMREQKDLNMNDWNIKVVMKKQPDSRRFIKVNWTPEDYNAMKADILVNPNPTLISAALKEMSLDKLLRHALLHILAGHKNELPEEQEYEMITKKLFQDA